MNNQQTTQLVNELRAQGFRVKASHSRRYRVKDAKGERFELSPNAEIVALAKDGLKYAAPKGGLTVVEVVTPSGQKFEAKAKCHENDSFNKKEGFQRGFSRAFNDLMKVAKSEDPETYQRVLDAVKNVFN